MTSLWQVDRDSGPAEADLDATGQAQLDGLSIALTPAGSAEPFPVRGFFNNVVTACSRPASRSRSILDVVASLDAEATTSWFERDLAARRGAARGGAARRGAARPGARGG
ncbi:hypothetical protein [Micromonospora sp. 067-2]|uniref:hypothetical protein n=1 Tax=Micromonospora sp. 067-2 TaxID=2789270 RepID=UPI00397B7BF8